MIKVKRKARSHRRGAPLAATLSGLVVLLAFLTPVFTPSASALQISATAKGKGPCPTDPYTGATDHPCPHNGSNNGQASSGSSGQKGSTARPNLTASYQTGVVKWQSCGWPAGAIGSTVQLYVAGVRMSGPGSSGTVLAGGCTSDPKLPLCLASNAYPAVAVDQPYGQAVTNLSVSRSGCLDPVTLGVASVGSSGGGNLPFTGANVLLMIAAAAILIVIGYAIVRLNRQRHRAI